MERLKRVTDEKGLSIFDVEDVVALLAHQRGEAFEGERAIRLYQFRIWILFPGTFSLVIPLVKPEPGPAKRQKT
jgi:hypothetical protein